MSTRQVPAASPAASRDRATVPRSGPPVQHEVSVVDGRFAHAECSCGWRGAGRRLRATARQEARDHALLYAEGSAAPPVEPR